MFSGLFEQLTKGMDGIFIYELEGNLPFIDLGKPYNLTDELITLYGAVVPLVPRNITENPWLRTGSSGTFLSKRLTGGGRVTV